MPIIDHLAMARLNSEAVLNSSDNYHVRAQDNLSKIALSMIESNATRNVFNESIESFDQVELPVVENINNQEGDLLFQIDEIFSSDKPDKIVEPDFDIYDFVAQLRLLNPDVRFSVKSDETAASVISSIDIDEISFPKGCKYNCHEGYLENSALEKVCLIESKPSSTIDAFYGEDKDKARKYFSKLADIPIFSETGFEEFEIAKTEDQKRQINNIIERINVDRREKGIDDLLIDERSVHFIKDEVWQLKYPDRYGKYSQLGQEIYVPASISKIESLYELLHELFHGSQYNAIKKNNDKYDGYRLGFEFYKDNLPYFCMVNEAITQQETIRLADDLLYSDPFYADELAEKKQIDSFLVNNSRSGKSKKFGLFNLFNKQRPSDLAVDNYSVSLLAGAYLKDRKTLNKLSASLARFSKLSKHDVYEMFVDSATKGNYLPIARLIEKKLGKGAFRKLGKESITSDGFAEFVDRVPQMKKTKKLNDIKKIAQNTFDKLFGRFGKKKAI